MKIVQAPCVIERESIPLHRAIERMSSERVNYLIFKSSEGELSGIFTERDLIRITQEIAEGDIWNKPMTSFMSRELKTLPVSLLQTAPEFMKKHSIRHVPITFENPENQIKEVVGIVTSDDVFDFMVNQRGLPPIFGGETLVRKRKTIGVASPDGSLWKLLDRVYEGSFFINVERFRYSNLQTPENLKGACQDCDALVLDLDEAPNRFWIPAVKYFSKNKDIEFVAVVCNEEKHTDVNEVLYSLEKEGVFRKYKKPLNISQLTVDLEKYWAKIHSSE